MAFSTFRGGHVEYPSHRAVLIGRIGKVYLYILFCSVLHRPIIRLAYPCYIFQCQALLTNGTCRNCHFLLSFSLLSAADYRLVQG